MAALDIPALLNLVSFLEMLFYLHFMRPTVMEMLNVKGFSVLLTEKREDIVMRVLEGIEAARWKRFNRVWVDRTDWLQI